MTDVRPLVVVAAAVTGLAVVGALPTWSGLAHHTALPPLDLFADVRVLLTEAPSYPWFVAGLVAAITVRSLVLAAMLGALHRAGLTRIATFYAVTLVPALVAGALGFAGVAAVYSLFLWIGVAVALVTVLIMGPGPWRGPPTRLYRPARAAITGYLVALLVVSLGSAQGSAATRVALVWVSAALTVLIARWLSGPPHEPPERRRLAGAALVLLLVVAPLPAASEPILAQGDRGTLFLVPGIGGSSGTSSMFGLDPAVLGFDCRHTAYFSYAGTGRGAPQRQATCPITTGAPYRAEDTRRPLRELAASFRDQLAGLAPPVVVVAHSQGAWVATAGLAETDAEVVDAVILLGAFPRHERGYVLDGTGPGVVGTDALEVLTEGLRGLDATSFDPRAPLAREELGTPGAIDRLMTAGFPAGVRVATVTSAFDLPVMPQDWELDGAADLCPVYVHHGELPTSSTVLRQVRGFLDGRDQDRCAWWHRWPTQAFAAFGTPEP